MIELKFNSDDVQLISINTQSNILQPNRIFYEKKPKFEKIIFNDSSTIVTWSDGTKTMVKWQDNEEYDAENAIAFAICKKYLSSKEYHQVLERAKDVKKKWVHLDPNDKEKATPIYVDTKNKRQMKVCKKYNNFIHDKENEI